jgi:hypothetical protein
MANTRYIQNLLLGLDEFANTIIGGAPGDTISGRAGRAARDNRVWGKFLCSILNWLQKNHCEEAIEHDAAGRHKESINIE